MNKLMKIGLAVSVIFPTVALAQLGTITKLVSRLGFIIDALIVLVAGIALLVFFWGLVKFILKIGGDEKAVAEGKRLMIWGLIALFVMISVWGLVRFIEGEVFGNLDTTNPQIPTFRP